jgi:hypothetical protein
LGVLIFRFTGELSPDLPLRLIVTLGYALGTISFPYATMFYEHQLSSFFFFSAFYTLFKWNPAQAKKSGLFLSGFLASYAILSQYTLALLLGPLAFYVFYKIKNSPSFSLKHALVLTLYFFLGIIPSALMLLGYNYACFDQFFVSGYKYVWLPAFQESGLKGIAGISIPSLRGLYFLVLSAYRGLFYFSPFLWFLLPGFYYFWRKRPVRAEFYLFLSWIVLLFLLYSAFYGWWGGWTYGPRYLIPILPFLVIPIVFVPVAYRRILTVLVSLSIIIQLIGSSLNPQIPDNVRNPIFDWAIPRFFFKDIDPNWGKILGLPGLTSLFPLMMIIILSFCQLFKEEIRGLWQDYKNLIQSGLSGLIFLSPFILNPSYREARLLFYLILLGISIFFASKVSPVNPSNPVSTLCRPMVLLGGIVIPVTLIYSASQSIIFQEVGFFIACIALFVIIINFYRALNQTRELGLTLFLTLVILLTSEFQGFLGEPVQDMGLFTFFQPGFTNQEIYGIVLIVFLILSLIWAIEWSGWNISSSIKQAKPGNYFIAGLIFSWLILLGYSLASLPLYLPFLAFLATITLAWLIVSLRLC